MQIRDSYVDEDLAKTWIRRFSSSRKRVLLPQSADSQLKADQTLTEETQWAFDTLERLVLHEPEKAWDLILLILQLASDDDDALSNLAAGPLESLLAHHGRVMIKQVESEARRNAEFKDLLGGVWKNMIPELLWQRIERARGD